MISNIYSYAQFIFYRGTGELYLGGIKSHTYNDNRCVADGGLNDEPSLHDCKEAVQKGMGIYWDFAQVNIVYY